MLFLLQTVALVLLVAASAAWAAPQGAYNYQEPQYPDAPAQYTFQWDVKDDYSGNFYGHQEHRDGDDTKGRYVFGHHNIRGTEPSATEGG